MYIKIADETSVFSDFVDLACLLFVLHIIGNDPIKIQSNIYS